MSEGGIPWTEGTARTRSQCGVHLAEEQQGGQSGWSGATEVGRDRTRSEQGLEPDLVAMVTTLAFTLSKIKSFGKALGLTWWSSG